LFFLNAEEIISYIITKNEMGDVQKKQSQKDYSDKKDDTTDGVDDEKDGGHDTNGDGINNGVGSNEEVEDGLAYSWNSDEDNFVDVEKSTTSSASLKWISFCGIIGIASAQRRSPP
jgi:hypothetical protein